MLQSNHRAHLGEHIARHIGFNVNTQAWAEAAIKETLRRWYPMPHHHFNRRSQRHRATRVHDHLYFFIIQRGAVDIRGVWPKYSRPACLRHFAMLAKGADTNMYRDVGIAIAGKLPVSLNIVNRAKFRPMRSQAQRQQLVFRGEILLGNSLEPFGVFRFHCLIPNRTIGKDSPHARIFQCADSHVGMLWRSLYMGPIENRSYPSINGAKGADQVPCVNSFRAVNGRKDVQDKRQIANLTLNRVIYTNVAQNPFPEVPMCIDEPRHDDHVRGVDDLGVDRPEVWSNRCDFRPFDQDIGPPEVAEFLVNGDDTAVL